MTPLNLSLPSVPSARRPSVCETQTHAQDVEQTLAQTSERCDATPNSCSSMSDVMK